LTISPRSNDSKGEQEEYTYGLDCRGKPHQEEGQAGFQEEDLELIQESILEDREGILVRLLLYLQLKPPLRLLQ
jgi:hypothetical protein